jgi:serine/threonine protein kinase
MMKGKRFTEEEARPILHQLLEILAYLHDGEESRLPVIHRDLRLSNIVWNEGRVYLIDFGFARHWNGEQSYPQEAPTRQAVRMNRRRPGTMTYAALRKEVSPRSDLFGAGVVGLDLFANWIENEELFGKPWQDILPASNPYKLFIERLLNPESRFITANHALEAISLENGRMG